MPRTRPWRSRRNETLVKLRSEALSHHDFSVVQSVSRATGNSKPNDFAYAAYSPAFSGSGSLWWYMPTTVSPFDAYSLWNALSEGAVAEHIGHDVPMNHRTRTTCPWSPATVSGGLLSHSSVFHSGTV